MKVTDQIYPVLPSAPPDTNYRLQHISSLQLYLEKEVTTRDELTRKYARAAGVASKADTALVMTALGLGGGGIALLTTIVATHIVIGMEVVAGVCGVGGMLCTYLHGRLNTKRNKHAEISTIARTKLNSITNLVARALEDGEITSEEYNLVVAEFDRYKTLKDEVRQSKNQKKILEKGKKYQEALKLLGGHSQ